MLNIADAISIIKQGQLSLRGLMGSNGYMCVRFLRKLGFSDFVWHLSALALCKTHSVLTTCSIQFSFPEWFKMIPG